MKSSNFKISLFLVAIFMFIGSPFNALDSFTLESTDGSSDDCQFRTQTPGGWGAPANGNNPGVYRDANFDAAFPDGLVVGCDYTLTLTSAEAVQNFLPSGGQPAPLSENLVDPDGHNVLAGHLVAATLSLTFDAYDPDFGDSDGYLGDLVFNSGDFSGWTISELLAIANEVYGGCNTDYSYSQITSALTTINENFVDGDSDNGNFDCEGCPDDEAPELVPEPENFSVECNEEIPEADYEAIDNYDPDPTVEFEEWIVEGDDPCTYEIHRHWVLTDDCENTSEYNQIISVSNNDTEAPVFDDVEAYYLLECDGLDDIVVTATDNCGNVTITHEDIDYSGGGCFGVVERTWTATDDCGNSATTSAVIEIDDTTPPEISGVGEDYTVDCEDYPAIDEVTVSDNCSADEDIEVVFEESTLDGDCDGSWVIVRTWTATDECGNSASVTQNITGVDNEPPVFTSVGEGVTIECDEDAPAPEYEVEDNCSSVSVEVTEDVEPGLCDSQYVIFRTYVATDDCGNSTEEVQVITIDDTTAPVLSDLPGDFNLECGADVPDPATLTATDNCDNEVEVELETSYGGDWPEGELASTCAGVDPANMDDPVWSLVLFEMPNGTEYYTTIEANWVTFEDEGEGVTAHLYGTVVSSSNENAGWDFEAWFYNGEGWDDWQAEPWPNSYKDDQGLAGDNYLDWMYYLMNADESFMTGWGDYEGSSLDLSHAPPNLYYAFQEGVAANNVNEEYGIGGWFMYEGLFVDAANDFEGDVSGGGDFAFDLDCCPQYEVTYTWTATDCAGNTTTHSQTITFDDVEEEPVPAPDVPTSNACDADLNHDGKVDIIDMIHLSSEFGCELGCSSDLDGNGKVDVLDFVAFSSAFGLECDE